MTTIAFKDGLLAADTAYSRGGSHMFGFMKIDKRASDGALAAVCGQGAYAGPFFEWFQRGGHGPVPSIHRSEDCADTGIVILPSGRATLYEVDGFHEMGGDYWAVGSGRDVALGAMFAGANPIKAVAAACRHDHGTGGEVMVHYLGLEEPPFWAALSGRGPAVEPAVATGEGAIPAPAGEPAQAEA